MSNTGNSAHPLIDKCATLTLVLAILSGPTLGSFLAEIATHELCGISTWFFGLASLCATAFYFNLWKGESFTAKIQRTLHSPLFCLLMILFVISEVSLLLHRRKEAEDISRRQQELVYQNNIKSVVDRKEKQKEELILKRLIENEVFFVGGSEKEIIKAYDENAIYIAHSNDPRHEDIQVGRHKIINRYLNRRKGKNSEDTVVGNGFTYRHFVEEDPILDINKSNTKAYVTAETLYRNTNKMVGQGEGSFQAPKDGRNKMIWIFSRPNPDAPWKIYEVHGGLKEEEVTTTFQKLKRNIDQKLPRDAKHFALPKMK